MAAKLAKTGGQVPEEKKEPQPSGIYLVGDIRYPRCPKNPFSKHDVHNVHLTLCYMGKGKITEKQAEAAIEVVKPLIQFSYVLESACTNSFKKDGKMRHDAQLNFDPRFCAAFDKAYEQILVVMGVDKEKPDYRWRPHLTVLSTDDVQKARVLASDFNRAPKHLVCFTGITTSCSPGAKMYT